MVVLHVPGYYSKVNMLFLLQWFSVEIFIKYKSYFVCIIKLNLEGSFSF